MEELREASMHHTAIKFSEDIKQMKVYTNLYKTVQVSAGRHVKRFLQPETFNQI